MITSKAIMFLCLFLLVSLFRFLGMYTGFVHTCTCAIARAHTQPPFMGGGRLGSEENKHCDFNAQAQNQLGFGSSCPAVGQTLC